MAGTKPKFGNVARITTMIVMTMSYFIVELAVGHITGSLALVADSFHMLSDVVALAVGLAAVKISKMNSRKSTFGWVRAEVLGALVNAVFLLALCFTIFVDSVQRLISPEEIQNLQLLLIVGSVGLGINIVGLFIFHDHPHGHSHGGHSHGGHSHEGHSHEGHSHEGHSHEGHSHGDHSHGDHSHGDHSHGDHTHGDHTHGDHSHGDHGGGSRHSHASLMEPAAAAPAEAAADAAFRQLQQPAKCVAIVLEKDQMDDGEVSHDPWGGSCSEDQSLDSVSNSASNRQLCTDRPGAVQPSPAAAGSSSRDAQTKKKDDRGKKDHHPQSSAQLNMRGIFLHVLGDALGSVVVIISALLVWLVPNPEGEGHIDWKPYIDPVLSLVLVAIIVSTTIPLLKESALILLQAVTTPLSVHQMKKSLEQMEGVLAVHELHVWQLAGSRHVASLHLSILSLDDYIRLSSRIKNYFHDNGVHSVTIQPEFDELQVKKEGRDCALECGPEQSCYMDTCCGKKLVPSATPQLLLQLIEAAEADIQQGGEGAATAVSMAAAAAVQAGESGNMAASIGIQYPGGSSTSERDFTVSTGLDSSRI